MTTPVLEIQNLTKHFAVGTLAKPSYVHALEDVSFKVNRGEVVAIVGESGSGKSTTVRLIARLMEPTRGEIIFKGQSILKTEPKGATLDYRSKVQMIFQDPFGSLNPIHTIGHHLERPLLIHKKAKNKKELQEKVETLLTTVGLNPAAEFAGKYPHQLSGGQRQRVAIARALTVDPEVILADEPISMLDVSIRMGVLNLMDKLKVDRGISYIYITHDIASARYIGDRTMVMYAGHMVEGAESTDLMQNPAHPYTKLLLSAVPNPHAGLGKQTHVEIPDAAKRAEIPSLIDLPPGCPFASRCPAVMSLCHKTMPAVTTLSAQHWVRCHLHTADESLPLPPPNPPRVSL
ncbi:MAG: ABC transporter ATP-binding protein [Anaerolineae bacterium]|nr:ABC transporter ATP-binding protein [Anaerolineae bacterium]